MKRDWEAEQYRVRQWRQQQEKIQREQAKDRENQRANHEMNCFMSAFAQAFVQGSCYQQPQCAAPTQYGSDGFTDAQRQLKNTAWMGAANWEEGRGSGTYYQEKRLAAAASAAAPPPPPQQQTFPSGQEGDWQDWSVQDNRKTTGLSSQQIAASCYSDPVQDDQHEALKKKFDYGKVQFRKDKKLRKMEDQGKGKLEIARHILANQLLIELGADPELYREVAHENYQRGSQHQNDMDGMVETQLKNVISGGKYDAKTMASSVARGVTQVNYERQATRLLTSFETAKKFYKLTEDEAYFDYLEAIKKVVDTNTDLNLDGREFRMPK